MQISKLLSKSFHYYTEIKIEPKTYAAVDPLEIFQTKVVETQNQWKNNALEMQKMAVKEIIKIKIVNQSL